MRLNEAFVRSVNSTVLHHAFLQVRYSWQPYDCISGGEPRRNSDHWSGWQSCKAAGVCFAPAASLLLTVSPQSPCSAAMVYTEPYLVARQQAHVQRLCETRRRTYDEDLRGTTTYIRLRREACRNDCDECKNNALNRMMLIWMMHECVFFNDCLEFPSALPRSRRGDIFVCRLFLEVLALTTASSLQGQLLRI